MEKNEACELGNGMLSLVDLRSGDLIRFSGEYYEVMPDGKFSWVISKIVRDGLVVQIDDRRTWVLSDGKSYSIDFDSNCHIELISRAKKNEKR